MIIQDVKDPRVGFVTVLDVELDPDYTGANVLVTVMGSKKEMSESVKALNDMRGFFQKEVGPALQTRLTPILRFTLDDRVEKTSVMEQLIAKARASDSDHVLEPQEENEAI